MAGVNRPLLFDVRAPIRAVAQLHFFSKMHGSRIIISGNPPGLAQSSRLFSDRSLAFDRAALARIASAPWLCVFLISGFFRRRVLGKLHHVIVVGVWNVHDAEWISRCRTRFRTRRFALCLRISPMPPTAMAVLRSERHGRLRERCDRRMEARRPPDFRGTLLAMPNVSGAR